MRTEHDDPVYPVFRGDIDNQGITIREYYAGLAMQGLLADGCVGPDTVTSDAVAYADALIEALNAIIPK